MFFLIKFCSVLMHYSKSFMDYIVLNIKKLFVIFSKWNNIFNIISE